MIQRRQTLLGDENVGRLRRPEECNAPDFLGYIDLRVNRRRSHMSRYSFAVSGPESRREGVIESDSFIAAVDALGQHVEVKTGDELEIGVYGFPPARFRCVGESKSLPVWMPAGQKAA
jgi:hypothetical protein